MRILHSVPATRRQALTLIELIVVMMILIALAGLLVPMLPSMLTRAHTSTCSTNMAECCKAITTYQALYQSYPNNWDALTDGTTMINYLAGSGLNGWPPGQGNGAGNGEVTQITLTAAEALNLTGVGITSVQPMVATAGTTPGDQQAFDPTFNYYVSTLPTTGALPITTGSILAGLDPTNPANTATIARCISLNLPLTGRMSVWALGRESAWSARRFKPRPSTSGINRRSTPSTATSGSWPSSRCRIRPWAPTSRRPNSSALPQSTTPASAASRTSYRTGTL